MTAHRDVILWIAIVFFIVSSVCSVHQKDKVGVCYHNDSVTVSANVSYVEMYKKFIGGKYCFYGCWETRSRIAYKTENKTIWVLKEECCPDYRNKNNICEPQCSPTCMNGSYCTQPNKCACNYGWNGNFCNESLYCFVRINSTEEMSEPPALKNVQNVSGNFDINWMLPECHLKCRDQLRITNTTVGKTRFADFILYFVPIDSSCNDERTSTSWKKYGILIGALIGIALFAVAIYAVFVVRMNRKITKKLTNQPAQVALSEFMEENEIYS